MANCGAGRVTGMVPNPEAKAGQVNDNRLVVTLATYGFTC